MTCRYPHHAASTGYQYGCRCARCVEWHRTYFRAYQRAHYVAKPRGKPGRRPTPVLERILARIVVDLATGCWLWTGSTHGNGYGQVKTDLGRNSSPHRVLAEHYHGAIPDGYEVDHLCHVRACCNPDHLQIVHRLENASRAATWSLAVRADRLVMSAEQVQHLRWLHHERGISIKELAQQFDIDRRTMRDAVTGRTWGKLAA